VPANAPHEVGYGDFRLEIHVVAEHEGGPAIPDAPILIYAIEKPVTPPSIGQLKTRNASYMARSDSSGVVVAHLIEGKTYSFHATADNFTREFRHLKRMDRHLANPMPLVLYNASKTIELRGKLQTTPNKVDKVPAVNGGVINIGSVNGIAITWLQNVTFHPLKEERLNKEYVARLSDTKLTLTWQNDVPSYADLGVRAGFHGQNEFWWETDAQSDGPGPAREELTVTDRAIEVPTTKRNPKFMAGPITRMPIYAPNGIEWKLTIDATFSTEPIEDPPRWCVEYDKCVYEPGFESAFAAAGVFLAGLLVRRRLR